ncbi:MAG TPA: NlpC/P60 family protein [Roseiflexaceae bacterium]|nr:NlpC/P60 family protein [Roseiflexaceae bacterium]
MSRPLRILLGTLALLPLLACAGSGQLPTAMQPRWACPSSTPLPWGEAGPVKAYLEGAPDPTTGIPARTPIYWQQWEQEYPTPGLAVYPSPTPYGYSGTTFALGQRVELVSGLHVQVDAAGGEAAQLPGAPQQVYRLVLTWHNATGAPLPVDYAQQLTLGAVVETGGAERADGWRTTTAARDLAALPPLPTAIPPGVSAVTVPVVAPPGRVKTVALALPVGRLPGPSSTPSPAATTPTPNTELRPAVTGMLTVQWTDTALRYFGAPPCPDAGALTPWGDRPQALAPASAPPGVGRLVQLLLAQVGKRYVWGATGPEQFDCSGLVVWAYRQIGITDLPRTTYTQFPALRPVGREQLLPGDLVYFAIQEPGRVDHVGVLVGDTDGDGSMDMIHAASPALGVRLERNVFGSRSFTTHMVGYRTLR